MCKDKAATTAWSWTPRRRTRSAASSATATTTSTSKHKPSSSSSAAAASSTISSATVLESLSDRPVLYSFPEILSATNNFLLKRHSSSYSSSPSWRCNLRDKDVLVFQRDSHGGNNLSLQETLSIVCRSHHRSLVRLLGACFGTLDSIFIVYEFVQGANLVDCLRNPRNGNPSYSPLPTWTARLQVVTDVSKGLEYIHRDSGSRRGRGNAVHNRIKSSSILILDRPQIAAVICHSGTAELTGEIEKTYRRRVEGTRGYMAPEILAGGNPTQKSDVFAFGVVALEVLSGEEPIRFRYDRENRGKMEAVSLVDTAREVLGAEEEEEERRRRVRRWVDRRLEDSFPVDVAVKAVELAVECVGTKAERRPGMEMVAGEMMRLLIKSTTEWESKTMMNTDFTWLRGEVVLM